MKRFNIFNQIHKALRALLCDTALILQQTDFNNPEEAEIALEKVRMALDIFDKHAEHEDKFVLPAIRQYEPSLVNSFEKEHMEDHILTERLRGLVMAFEKEQMIQTQLETGHALLHSFIAFMTFNLEHMGKEETLLNEKLWKYYSDAELTSINQQLAANIPHDEIAFTSAWMMKGMSNGEITAWLKTVQKNASEIVFSNLFSIAEKELPFSRFRKILENLTEGAMVA